VQGALVLTARRFFECRDLTGAGETGRPASRLNIANMAKANSHKFHIIGAPRSLG